MRRPKSDLKRLSNRCAGFTILEMLVALTVLGVATFILITMFLMSLSYDSHSRYMKVATNGAESVAAQILATPEDYVWPTQEQLQSGGSVALELKDTEKDPIHRLMAPSVLPTIPARAQQITDDYERFRWFAYARQPASVEQGGATPPYLEVEVVIRWSEAELPYYFSVVSTIPYTWVENAA